LDLFNLVNKEKVYLVKQHELQLYACEDGVAQARQSVNLPSSNKPEHFIFYKFILPSGPLTFLQES
jgi:hypothetical protein